MFQRMVQVFVVLASMSSFALVHGSGPSDLAKAKPFAVAAVAIVTFTEEYPAEMGRPLVDELLGFHVKSDGQEVDVHHVTGQGALTSVSYGCHFHGAAAHCERSSNSSSRQFPTPRRFFKPADFQTALGEALAVFEKEAGPASSIRELKAWQNRGGIEMIVSRGAAGADFFLMCHYHGASIDCHSKSKPGSGQP